MDVTRAKRCTRCFALTLYCQKVPFPLVVCLLGQIRKSEYLHISTQTGSVDPFAQSSISIQKFVNLVNLQNKPHLFLIYFSLPVLSPLKSSSFKDNENIDKDAIVSVLDLLVQ